MPLSLLFQPFSFTPYLPRRRYLQAAAALVLHPGSAGAGELLRLLCWVPAKRFTPRLLEVARLCWCWTWAATGMDMQVGV